MAPNTLAGLSLRDLEYAVAVADLRHFGRAAARCGVSQAGLSEQVRKLEGFLGVALFERSTRRVAVTQAGETLLRQAREVLATGRTLLEMAATQAEPLCGPLRLGVIATLAPYYIPALLRNVRTRFARLELRLQEGLTASLIQALQGGVLDAVLLALPLGEEGIASAALFFEPFRAVLPARHPLTERQQAEELSVSGIEQQSLDHGRGVAA